MCRGPARLDGPAIVAGDIHHEGPLLHETQILTRDDVVLAVLRPENGVEKHVRLAQALFEIGAVRHEERDVSGHVLLRRKHRLNIHVEDAHFVAERRRKLRRAQPDIAAADNRDDRRRNARHVRKQLARTAVHGLHVVACGEKSTLACEFAHRSQEREPPVPVLHILVGHSRNPAREKAVRLFAVGVGMDIGEQDLVPIHPFKLLRKQLLNLVVELRAGPHLVGRGDLRPDCSVFVVAIAAANPGTAFDVHLVPVAHDLMHRRGNRRHAILVRFDLLQDPNNHNVLLLSAAGEPDRFVSENPMKRPARQNVFNVANYTKRLPIAQGGKSRYVSLGGYGFTQPAPRGDSRRRQPL